MQTKFYLILLTLTSVNAFASIGTGMGNGGDICEDRFKSVRDDIASWIIQGGSAGLSLPQPVSVAQYNTAMLGQIANATISCIDDKVMIGDAEKTCKNFVDSSGKSQIACNATRFMATGDSDQYVLVHHEYAGLAGFEVNSGEESQYPISNQLTEYLQDQVIQKLAIKPRLPEARTVFEQANVATVADLDVGTARSCDYYFSDARLDEEPSHMDITIERRTDNTSQGKPSASGITISCNEGAVHSAIVPNEVVITARGISVLDDTGFAFDYIRSLGNKTLIFEIGVNNDDGVQSVSVPSKWAFAYMICKATGKSNIFPGD
jgi:hypothetical protein